MSNDFLRAVRLMYSYPWRYRRSVLVTQVLVLVAMLLAIVVPLVIRKVIDVGVLSGNSTILLGSSLVVLGIGALAVLCLYTAKRVRFGVAGRSVNNVRHDLLAHLLRLDPHDAQEATGGQALARLTTDATGVRGVANGGLFEVANQIVVASATAAVCLWLDWRVTLIALAPMLPMALGNVVVQYRLQRIFSEIRAHIAGLLSGIVESLANVAAIKSYGREADNTRSLSDINEKLAERRRRMRMTYGIYNACFASIGGLTMPLALYFGAMAVIDNRISVGAVVALIALIMMLQMNIHMIIMDGNGAFRAAVFGRRLLALLDAPPAVVQTSTVAPRPIGSGRLTAKRLTLRLGERALLDGVDIEIADGETVAIVGPTGTGKSALLHVLARLRDATSGEVRYDNIDARNLPLKDIRSHVVCLPQRQWIFEGTLRENIAFAAPDCAEPAIAEAARAAGIGHLSLDRHLTAGAPDLSAGERQRVGLARALLVDPPILMLDNPTANLDAHTEAAFLATLQNLRHSRTMIIATHHPSVALIADRVMVLDHGRLMPATAVAQQTMAGAEFVADLRLTTTTATGA